MVNQPLYTKLNNGIRMPMIGLGVYDMHHQEAEKAVKDALEIGYRLIDTAAMYQNETEIGNAVRDSGIPREDLFITTKLNNTNHGFDSTLRAFEESLQKLKTEYIDLYLIHWPIKGKRKESWLALERLYQEKKVRAIGVANYLIPFLEELREYAEILPAINQVEFTPWLFQKDLLNYCQEHHIQLQSYSPLTRGIKFGDPRLSSLCQKYDKTPAQIILRWNLEHGISSIPKSIQKTRLLENFSVFDFSLSKEDIQILDGLNEDFRICDNPISML